MIAAVNGVPLQAVGEELPPEELQERAWSELLRQEAVRRGLLPPQHELQARPLSADEQAVVEAMLQHVVQVPSPSEEECRRWYEADAERFVEGRQVHLRHILFAVTPGVDVHALAVRAEEALLDLLRKDAPPGLFAQRARELSNCPSGAEGGDLGWIGPQDCCEELANELFHLKNPLQGIGLRPRLVHTRHGLHIVEVLGRRQGRQAPFGQVRQRVVLELAQQARATALHHYIRVLAGQAQVAGLDLEAAETPLLQ